MKMLDSNQHIRLNAELIDLTEGQKLVPGCWNFTIRNNKTDEIQTTQGDAHAGYKWSDMKEWLFNDIAEMDFGEYEDLSIIDVEYAGI